MLLDNGVLLQYLPSSTSLRSTVKILHDQTLELILCFYCFFLLSNYNKNNDVMLSTLEPISDGDSSVPRCVAQTREQLQPYIISLLQHYCQYLCNIGTDSAAFWFWSELLEHCGQYLCNILIYCGTLWSTFLPLSPLVTAVSWSMFL